MKIKNAETLPISPNEITIPAILREIANKMKKKAEAINTTPDAKPSTPSIRFNELHVITTILTVNNILKNWLETKLKFNNPEIKLKRIPLIIKNSLNPNPPKIFFLLILNFVLKSL